ncbi:helix-turn-helix domain-containing protein [Pseudoramibacter alactolyticus]
MSHYKPLTPEEREKIDLLHSQNKTLSGIAKTIHRDKSTISREIPRNGCDGLYSPGAAHTQYLERRTACRPKLKLSDPERFEYVRDKLEYFPKSSILNDVSEAYIQSKVDEMNKRPRKCLGFRTPYEVYHSTVLHLA